MSKSTAILPTALKTNAYEITLNYKEAFLQKQRMRQVSISQSCFLQDIILTMPMAPCSFIYIFPQEPPRRESPIETARGWLGELTGICFQTASADSIHQNQIELFKDALSMTLLCWRSSTLSLHVTEEAKLTHSCCFCQLLKQCV